MSRPLVRHSNYLKSQVNISHRPNTVHYLMSFLLTPNRSPLHPWLPHIFHFRLHPKNPLHFSVHSHGMFLQIRRKINWLQNVLLSTHDFLKLFVTHSIFLFTPMACSSKSGDDDARTISSASNVDLAILEKWCKCDNNRVSLERRSKCWVPSSITLTNY